MGASCRVRNCNNSETIMMERPHVDIPVNSPKWVQTSCHPLVIGNGVKSFGNPLTSLSASWGPFSWCQKEQRNCPSTSCPDHRICEYNKMFSFFFFFCHCIWYGVLFSNNNWNRWVYLRRERLIWLSWIKWGKFIWLIDRYWENIWWNAVCRTN